MIKFDTEEALLKFTENIKGRTFKELDKLNLLATKKRDKGILGKIVETGFYRYPLNNDIEADFSELGIELKVSGFERTKTGLLSAKERISLSMIDYHTIIHETYEFSKFLLKNRKLLIIWYEYERGKERGDFKVWDYQLYNMSQDEHVIKNDFHLIQEKIKNGKAHLLSEGDTSYLGACTKGRDGKVRVTQPNAEEPARPRAFCLKNSYMRGILRSINEEQKTEQTTIKTVRDYIYKQIEAYIGMTQLEIYEKLTNKQMTGRIPKNIGKMISNQMIGKDNELKQKHGLFNKTTYIIKNVPVDEDYNLLERLTFRNIVQSEFADPWDESDWKKYFEEVTFLLICYEGKGKKNGHRTLKGMKEITFNADDIDSFGKTYEKIRQAIGKKDIALLPYPKTFPYQKLEIAPKGLGGDDAYNTFFNRDRTKTCLMMDKDFVRSKMK